MMQQLLLSCSIVLLYLLPNALSVFLAEKESSTFSSVGINKQAEDEHRGGSGQRRRDSTSTSTSRRNNLEEEAGQLTKSVLDALAQLKSPLNEYNQADWERLQSCLEPALLNVSDAAWAGFLEYASNNGAPPDDIWGIECDISKEQDPTPLPPVTDNHDMITIMEPCNTMSNLAFYRSMWTICELQSLRKLDNDTQRAFKLAFTSLAWGSIFFHSSLTKLGVLLDEYLISLIMLLAHQVSLQGFTNDPILFNLQKEVPLLYPSALELTWELERIILQESVSDWREMLGNLKQETPTFFLGAGGIIATNTYIIFPPKVASAINMFLRDLLLGGSNDTSTVDFIIEEFSPAFAQALEANKLPLASRFALFNKFFGSLIKFLWGFLWEERYIPLDFIFDPKANQVGAKLMPMVNHFANSMTGFDRASDPNVQKAVDTYPGDIECRVGPTPHAKWQETSANSLIDFVINAEFVNAILVGKEVLPTHVPDVDIAQCYYKHECMSDFDWDYLSPTVSLALEECIGFLISENNNNNKEKVGIGGFVSCILSSLMTDSRGSSMEEEIDTADIGPEYTLDMCLNDYSCIEFDNRFRLNGEKLFGCTTKTLLSKDVPLPPCASQVNGKGVLSCIHQDCHDEQAGSNSMCLLSCLQKHGTVSPIVVSAIGCFNVLLSPLEDYGDEKYSDQASKSHLNACILQSSDPIPPRYTFLEGFVAGMRELARCSATPGGPCSTTWLTIGRTLINALDCADTCLVESRAEVKKRNLPADISWQRQDRWLSVACAFRCFLDDA